MCINEGGVLKYIQHNNLLHQLYDKEFCAQDNDAKTDNDDEATQFY